MAATPLWATGVGRPLLAAALRKLVLARQASGLHAQFSRNWKGLDITREGAQKTTGALASVAHVVSLDLYGFAAHWYSQLSTSPPTLQR